jgi:predicted molibdopterin-dependent oxidoreductase YjgC
MTTIGWILRLFLADHHVFTAKNDYDNGKWNRQVYFAVSAILLYSQLSTHPLSSHSEQTATTDDRHPPFIHTTTTCILCESITHTLRHWERSGEAPNFK